MTHPTPVSSLPAVPPTKRATVIRRIGEAHVSCARREMDADPEYVQLVGFDADGAEWVRMRVRLDYGSLDGMERLIDRESQRWQRPLTSRWPTTAFDGLRLVR